MESSLLRIQSTHLQAAKQTAATEESKGQEIKKMEVEIASTRNDINKLQAVNNLKHWLQGHRLHKAKRLVPHGKFIKWHQQHLGLHPGMVNRAKDFYALCLLFPGAVGIKRVWNACRDNRQALEHAIQGLPEGHPARNLWLNPPAWTSSMQVACTPFDLAVCRNRLIRGHLPAGQCVDSVAF
jgi:hypothetical protein